MDKLQLELPLFEQWLPIEGYEDFYQVSNFGRVKSVERIDSLGRTVKERILKQTTKKGYQRIGLWKDEKQLWFYVHRLVAMTFIDNSNNYEQVNHKDENPSNNHVSNLEWCTAQYNINYGTRNEKVSKAMSGDNHPKPTLGKFGKDNPKAKQIVQLTLGGEVVRNWDSVMDVERNFGYKHGNISNCCKGKRNTAYGYKWQYA